MKFEIVYHCDDNNFETSDINEFKEKTDENQKRFVIVKTTINDNNFPLAIPTPLDQYRPLQKEVNIFAFLLHKCISTSILHSTEEYKKNLLLFNYSEEEIISKTEIGKLIKENYSDYWKHLNEEGEIIYNLSI